MKSERTKSERKKEIWKKEIWEKTEGRGVSQVQMEAATEGMLPHAKERKSTTPN